MRTRDWVLLAVVTGTTLLLLGWAVSLPAVCAVAGPCDQGARVVPSAIGAAIVTLLAVGTAVIAYRTRGRTTEGVRRSEGIIAIGTAAVAGCGILFLVLTLFSAGVALRI